ncbi:MAG: hypothetical protein KDJ35_04275 [Alphaproteobacteria bacterium]|nr:hypothetical protein [Alphaproteobacteria bacterium]
MPHITVEYTETLSVDMPKLLSALHKDLAGRESVNIHAIKTRAIPVQYSIVGDGHEDDKMIHICLKLLPGRSDELRTEMAQGLQAAARKIAIDDRIAITVETADLHAASYTK